MALVSVIRRWHWRDHVPIREIARRTGLSRNTVRKYLADDAGEPSYPSRISPSKLDDYAEQLQSWLKIETRKGRKQRRNVKQLYRDLVTLGYTGSYDRVAAYARQWREAQQTSERTTARGTFVPLQFAAGEAFQFDWSEDWAVIGGHRTKLQVAHFKLSYSRAFILRAYLLQTHEMLFDAHNHAFAVWGGVPRRGIYDNMKTAVDQVLSGKRRTVNARFAAMVSHYLFEAEFCNPAAGWEKGQIEKNVQDARHRLWHNAPTFTTLGELNAWLQTRCITLWQELPHPELRDSSIADVWKEEQAQLMKLPRPFDGFIEHTKRVSPTCLIHYDRNRYSVPATFANRLVSLRVYADRLVMVAEGNVIAEHARMVQRNHDGGYTYYDWRHYLTVLQRKPGALRNGAPFKHLPPAFKQLQAILQKRTGGEREMVDVLALVLHHDEQAVLAAVELALESGAPSKQHILNILSRLLDPSAPAPIDAPPVLALQIEPTTDTSRYDQLREVHHGR